MKKLLILSGKGGTGKTTVAGAFISVVQPEAYADCDVDAPNLHLISSHRGAPEESPYYALPKAVLDMDSCVECDLCRTNCRFGAITNDGGYRVDLYACEGCGACEYLCPATAIQMVQYRAGTLTLYREPSVFSTAELKMGSGNSGLLVTEVKRNLDKAAPNAELVVIDGAPGIGCPVIASISGVDLVLLVAEPSVSGMSDLKRVIETVHTFNTAMAVCVNKYDIDRERSMDIENFCTEHSLPFVGRIPFDPEAVQTVNLGKSIVDTDCPAANALREMVAKTLAILWRE